jgi:predicted permease
VNRERSRRIYRALTRLAPPRIRDRHREEMEAMFLDALEAASGNRRQAAATWIAAAADIGRARLQHPVRRRRDVPVIPRERRPIMIGIDFKYTLRWLARQKTSTALVVGMLSVGMAANIVVFSLVNALFLRPFPFVEAERLVDINETAPQWNLEVVGINFPDFHQWRQANQTFDSMAMYDVNAYNLSDDRGAERIEGAAITYDFPRVLRIAPLLGRTFTADEDRPKGPPVVVIGEGLWDERFGRRDDVLGRTLKLNGVVHAIIGVVPRIAEFPGRVRLWVPFAGDLNQPYQSYGYNAVGRLKPGVTVADAQKDLLRTQQPIWDARDKDRVVSPYAKPLHEQFVRDLRGTARTLQTAVTLLLFVACANVASVMLARALARRREIGIRLAVGASRMRIARQLFVENLTLSALGGVAGLAAGRWALHLLLVSAGEQVPAWANFGIDVRIIAFAIALIAATALLFGWAPALHAIRGTLQSAVQDASRGTTAGPGGRRTLSVLVTAEFALAAVLLVCGGLMLQAYQRVQKTDPGFRVDHVVTFSVALPQANYGDDDHPEQALAFWDRLAARLSTLPGVDAAGLVSCPPLGCHWGMFFRVEGAAPLAPGQTNPVVLFRPATPGYFAAMGIRLKSGRFFNDTDGRNGNRAIIVNETFVKTFWPGVTDPVGRRVRGIGKDSPWNTVVGYVQDVKHYGLERPMRPGVYVPLVQVPSRTMTVAIRTAGDPAAIVPSARALVRDMDPDLALYRVETMDQSLRKSLAQRSLYSWLLGVFAGMALILALGGTYGVTSYLVSQRTREIGIRVALGARRRDITATVMRGSLIVVGAGVVLGTLAALLAAKGLADRLFGVSPHDPSVLGASIAILATTALLANWFPARRAARIDPMRFLRTE